MIGKVFNKIEGSDEDEKQIIVTFKTTPEDAIVVLKNRDKMIVPPIKEKTYKIMPGLYYIDVKADNYSSIKDEKKILLENETIEIILNGIYGIKRKVDNNIDTIWIRIGGNIGKIANAVHGKDTIETTQNDFDNIYPWSNIRTCALSKDGKVLKYIDEPNFSTSKYEYIMVEVPEFYWNRTRVKEDDGSYDHIYISKSKTTLTPYRSEKFYIGKYEVTQLNEILTTNTRDDLVINGYIDTFRTKAKNIGINWGLIDIWRLNYIQMLYLVEYADNNSQEILGLGKCSDISNTYNGDVDILKDKSGYLKNDGQSSMLYRGIEDLYSKVNYLIDGIIFQNGMINICTDRNKYGNYNDDYISFNVGLPTQSGIIRTVKYHETYPGLISLPEEVDSYMSPEQYNTYWYADKVNDTPHDSGVVYSIGCYHDSNQLNGIFSIKNLNYFYDNVATRLLYIPEENSEG